MSLSTWAGCIALGALAIASGGTAPSSEPATTLGDLQIAYNLECNARGHYLAVGKQADREGYHRIASLMRAAARGEQIHSATAAAEIYRLGGTPKTEIVEETNPRSLREHLTTAAAEESYERDRMYTMFLNQARDEKNDAAVASFSKFRHAESTHARLIEEALENFKQMKSPQAFYVCTECGAVTPDLQGGECMGCGNPAEAFEKVN